MPCGLLMALFTEQMIWVKKDFLFAVTLSDFLLGLVFSLQFDIALKKKKRRRFLHGTCQEAAAGASEKRSTAPPVE